MTDHHHHDAPGHSHGHGLGMPGLGQPDSPELAECPVMPGSMVVKADAEAAGLVRDYNGTRYYLCCAGCGPKFDADPERYAAVA